MFDVETRAEFARPPAIRELASRMRRNRVDSVDSDFLQMGLEIRLVANRKTARANCGEESLYGFFAPNAGRPETPGRRPPPSVRNANCPGDAVAFPGRRTGDSVVGGGQIRQRFAGELMEGQSHG